MTERTDSELFEARFADRVHAYTEVATVRPFDASATSRTAMTSARNVGWPERLMGDRRGLRIGGARFAAIALGVVLVGVVAVGLLGQPHAVVGPQPTSSASATSAAAAAGGPIPDDLIHSWERPYAVTPGLDRWPTASLRLTSDLLEVGPGPVAETSRSTVSTAGASTIDAVATTETRGCATGDQGAYHWSVDSKDTVLTLTPSGTDACAARQTALAGDWVRSDLPPVPDSRTPLQPGPNETSSFDPFGGAATAGRLSYTVPAGWSLEEDAAGSVTLRRLEDTSGSQPSHEPFIALIARPAVAAEPKAGVVCGPFADAPGIGHSVADIVAAITTRPGVESTSAPVTIGGYDGQVLDLRVAASSTSGCLAPDGLTRGIPILLQAGSANGPAAGIDPDHPIRLILLDLGGGRTMAAVIFDPVPSSSSAAGSSFEAQVAKAMPVIESFEFHPSVP